MHHPLLHLDNIAVSVTALVCILVTQNNPWASCMAVVCWSKGCSLWIPIYQVHEGWKRTGGILANWSNRRIPVLDSNHALCEDFQFIWCTPQENVAISSSWSLGVFCDPPMYHTQVSLYTVVGVFPMIVDSYPSIKHWFSCQSLQPIIYIVTHMIPTWGWGVAF